MTYKWKTPLYKVGAQETGEYLECLEEQHGAITAKLLLDESRPVTAILHSCYEWNDEKAAEKYRLGQSKEILSNLTIVMVENDGTDTVIQPVRAYVSMNGRNETASYISTVKALSNKDARNIVLENAKSELKSFVQKYNSLCDVAELLKAELEKLQ